MMDLRSQVVASRNFRDGLFNRKTDNNNVRHSIFHDWAPTKQTKLGNKKKEENEFKSVSY